MNAAALIVAAGKGTRMGPGVDKLFLKVAGRPVVAHTWERFDRSPDIDRLVLVVRDGMQDAFREMAAGLRLGKPWQIVIGGAERQDSVWNGLQALPSAVEVVAIQDGARPCTNLEVIAATVRQARSSGAAVAAQKVTDTIKESADGTTISAHLDRARLWAVQTPQAFRVGIIRHAIESAVRQGRSFTDDTAACEALGQAVSLVASLEPNPKVTTPADLPYVEMLLSGKSGT